MKTSFLLITFCAIATLTMGQNKWERSYDVSTRVNRHMNSHVNRNVQRHIDRNIRVQLDRPYITRDRWMQYRDRDWHREMRGDIRKMRDEIRDEVRENIRRSIRESRDEMRNSIRRAYRWHE